MLHTSQVVGLGISAINSRMMKFFDISLMSPGFAEVKSGNLTKLVMF